MTRFKPSLLTLALATAGLTSGLYVSPVSAQEQTTTQEESAQENEVSESTDSSSQNENATETEQPIEEHKMVITGYRGSLIRSLDEKRYADTVSEQLSSDDLGSLPDVSIADALTRLPGISAVRTGGQAAEINIRGLSGGFILATLNGREQVSTGGTRSVEFDQYPSELIASGAVYKSQKASLIEGGVAGTVELRTASPLQNKEQHTFSFNARGMYNDRAEEIYDAEESGSRLSFSYQGKFADDTVGLSLGFARLDQPSVATQFIGLHYNDQKDVDGDQDFEFISEGFEMQHKGGTEIRDGYVAAVEWTPSNTFSLTADAFLSKFDSEQFARGLRVKFGGPTAHFYNPNIFQNNVVGATVVRTGQSYTRVEIANDDDSEVDEIANYGVNANWQLTDNFSLSADLSYSGAESDFQNRLLWSLVAEDATIANPVFDTGVAINYQLNDLNLPDASFNQNFADINRVMVSKYGTYPFEYKDNLKAFKLDGVYDLQQSDWFSSFEMGVRFSERNYDKERSLFEYGSDGSFLSSEPPFRLNSSLATPVSFSGDFASFPSYLAVDIDAVLAAWLPAGTGQPVQTWGVNALGELDNHSAWSVLQSGEVTEKVSSAYFQANIDAMLGEMPVTGNIGLRVVHTDQSASTLQNVEGDPLQGAQNIVDEAGIVNDQYAPGTDGVTYTDYLPQINLNFKLTEDTQLRFAAARVMSRAPIQRLVSEISGQVNLDTQEFNATSVNSPQLKPFMADQYDLSYEYYFSETDGALIAAIFYKDIKSFIDQFTVENFDFSTTNIAVPETYLNPVSLEEFEVRNGSYTTAVNNTGGGYIQGFELAYTQVFSMLPEPWSGLGVSGSYAYTDSEVSKLTDFGGSSIDLPLDGLSKDVISATVFYEYDDFETRINVRHRSRFVSEQIAVNEQTVFFDGETVVDYQASYAFDESGTIVFQVNNVTDQPTKSYFGTKAQTGTIQYFGRQFFLGMTYQL
ncbi:TonB-dependent receptor [Aliikangiella coralliicola]|uniref:TonB-dependent receptor n=1 Tax=Aliikangiella coralliicola TaxID=2592383 RepID=A0A545UJM7_9GAMM|nr:TonB-dependent receptor [Aliikangiella coralliicola]TQV89675.1 TonB-dependent receptor [Aliikangiella coralliicola]